MPEPKEDAVAERNAKAAEAPATKAEPAPENKKA
jgi:hypothetical protein